MPAGGLSSATTPFADYQRQGMGGEDFSLSHDGTLYPERLFCDRRHAGGTL